MHGAVRQLVGKVGVLACLGVMVVGTAATDASAKRGVSFDASDVRREIRRDLPRISRCYESALRHEPSLSGKVAVKFAVARRGDVRDMEVVQNTTGNQEVGRCVARVVSKIRFQPRSSGQELLRFTLPFVFALQ